LYPNAVLSLPVEEASALAPIAVLLSAADPFVSDAAPTAVLLSPLPP